MKNTDNISDKDLLNSIREEVASTTIEDKLKVTAGLFIGTLCRADDEGADVSLDIAKKVYAFLHGYVTEGDPDFDLKNYYSKLN